MSDAQQLLQATRLLIETKPNDGGTVNAMQQCLHATAAGTDAVRLLMDYYQSPAASGEVRGVLSTFMLSVLRRDAKHFNPAVIGLDTNSDAFKKLYRGPSAHLEMMFAEIDLVTRFQQNLYDVQSAPKFMIAIPKSGSSLLGTCLGNMIKLARGGQLDGDAFLFRGYPDWWNAAGSHDWDLRPEIGADSLFRDYPGGVYKGHIEPIEKNFAVLEMYEHSRCVLVLRDPRDQIVAEFCQKLRFGGGLKGDVHDELHAFMRSGALLEKLTYAGKWLKALNRDRSIVVTYEQLMAEPFETLGRMNTLYELGLPSEALEDVHAYCERVTNRTGTGHGGADTSAHDASIYPLGWTGKTGVWRDYFDERCSALFDRVMEMFRDATPWGDALDEVYPDLEPSQQAAA